MAAVSREFQVFAKPIGATCNLSCRYCYYLEKSDLYPSKRLQPMTDEVLEAYIAQHLAAAPGGEVNFSWHGGEPTMLGIDYFAKIVALQKKLCPPGSHITNGIQTNGTLLDEKWCRFLAREGFRVGVSIDGPADLHDRYRVTPSGSPSHERALRGYELLRKHRIPNDILCVVHAGNVGHPLEAYRFFKGIKAEYLSFLPLVEAAPSIAGKGGNRSVDPDAWGAFLCAIFDAWVRDGIGKVKVQIFEEALREAFGQEHSLCILRRTCGDIPVVEHNGDVYACDHFVDPDHLLGNLREQSLGELLASETLRAFGKAKWSTLPGHCRTCDVLSSCHGGCPKDRFLTTPDGEKGLNYLCRGYKRFFTHCRPLISEIAALNDHLPKHRPMGVNGFAPAKSNPKTGRNAPCPCGSGRKYKKCCLNK